MDIRLKWKTTKEFEIAVTDQDGQPLPLDGKVIKLIAKKKISDLDSAAVFTLTVGSGITVPGLSGENTALVKIEPVNTASLPREKTTSLPYIAFLEIGTDRYPLGDGNVIVEPSVAE